MGLVEKWKRILDPWERFLEQPRSAGQRYGAVLLLEALVIPFSFALEGRHSHVPMSFIYFGIAIFSAFYGGFGPAILGGFISSVAIDYFYTEPLGAVLTDWSSLVLFGGVLGMSTFLSFLASTLRLAYQRAKHDQRLAEEATRAREHTLAVVSHDLRQPLTSISLQMQLLKRHGHPDVAEKTLQAVSQMQRLIQDLLDASRVDQGSFTLKLERRNVCALVTDLAESFRRQAELRGVELELRNESDRMCEALIDGVRIRQALSNIIENAIKFTPEGGTVRLAIFRPAAGTIEVQIRDTGPGILKENLTRIFERNWQAKDTAHMGTGLGLFIARGIVHAHHGEIRVESEVGRGATFTVRLPAVKAASLSA